MIQRQDGGEMGQLRRETNKKGKEERGKLIRATGET